MCLVESDSNILLIGHKDSSMSRILVYKLADLVQQRFLPMKSIGDNCLIVGERSMSVSSRVLPTVEGDSVIVMVGRTYVRRRRARDVRRALERVAAMQEGAQSAMQEDAQGTSTAGG